MRTIWSIVPCLAIVGPEVWAQQQTSGNAFNPAVSLILQGSYASYRLEPDEYALAGFLLDADTGLTPSGVSLDETELVLSANVDDKFYGFASLALEQDDTATEVELEEAWFETQTLPHGLKVKAGRFLSELGYLNAVHAHAWDFIDAPLVYTAMLGSTYGDSGVQLRWVAPTPVYLELAAELFRGDAFPSANGAESGGTGARTLIAHVGGDVGSSHSWRAGVARLSANPRARESAVNTAIAGFSGDSDLTVVDFVWKWARNGNPRERHVVVQLELMRRNEAGRLSVVDPGAGPSGEAAYDGDQRGWYLQGIYQFRPRWRVGARLDGLSTANSVSGIAPLPPLDATHDPRRFAAMIDFSNSEFSRLRFQWNRDDSRPQVDDQLFLQYIMSIGAHGAHRF